MFVKMTSHYLCNHNIYIFRTLWSKRTLINEATLPQIELFVSKILTRLFYFFFFKCSLTICLFNSMSADTILPHIRQTTLGCSFLKCCSISDPSLISSTTSHDGQGRVNSSTGDISPCSSLQWINSSEPSLNSTPQKGQGSWDALSIK